MDPLESFTFTLRAALSLDRYLSHLPLYHVYEGKDELNFELNSDNELIHFLKIFFLREIDKA